MDVIESCVFSIHSEKEPFVQLLRLAHLNEDFLVQINGSKVIGFYYFFCIVSFWLELRVIEKLDGSVFGFYFIQILTQFKSNRQESFYIQC
jgi:hypothetical protein